MDRETTEKLNKFGASEEDMRKIMKHEDTHKETRDVLEAIKKDKRLSLKDRERAARQLDSPELHNKTLVVDEEKSAKLGDEIGEKIKAAIRRGDLPPPKMDQFQEDMRKRMGK